MEVNKNKAVAKTPSTILKVFNTELRYLKVKDVKRAYSKLIQEYCKGTIVNENAKTLGYLLAGYMQTVKQFELEKRIIELEKKSSNVFF